VNLNTDSVGIANEIARTVRASGRLVTQADGTKKRIPGKLKYLKAIGWYIEEYGKAQVSMNLTNMHITSVHHAFEACVEVAEQLGVKVTGSELIGLIPQQPLIAAGEYYRTKLGKDTIDTKELIGIAQKYLLSLHLLRKYYE